MERITRSAHVACWAAVILVAGLSPAVVRAQSAYFDVNGTAAGYGVVNGGSYSWDDANWAAASGGTTATTNWVQGSFARFAGGSSGTAYTVTVNGDEQNVGLFMNVNGVTLTINAAGAGTLNVLPGVGSPPVQGFFGGTGATVIINAPISGTGGIQPQNGGNLYFNGVNTYSGGTKLTSGATLVYFNSGSSFGTGDITIAATGFAPLLGVGGSTITLPNNFIHTTSGGGINFAAAANTPVVSTGTWSLGVSNLSLRNNGPTTSPLTLSGAISGSAGITLSANNNGTIIFSGPNTYTGTTTISVGNTPVTLKLGAAGTIASSTQILFAGGNLNPGGFDHDMTAATVGLTGNSNIDFVAGPSELRFANSSAVAWTAGRTLNLANWNPPATKVRFGTDATGLASAQLAQISFNGGGLGTATIDPNGYIVQPAGGPTINTQPQSTPAVCANTIVQFTVAATGSGTLTYQWYRNNIPMSGEIGVTLTLTAGSENALNGDQYHVLVSDANGSTASDHATLSVFGPPTFTQGAYNATVTRGSSADFTVGAESHTTPATLTYRWYRAPSTMLSDGVLPGGTGASGTTGPTLMLSGVQPGDAGSYFVTVTDACGVAVSSPMALLTVVPKACGLAADSDGDGDVDMDDFAAFQQCYSPTGVGYAAVDCGCFDRAGVPEAVDEEDFDAFAACAEGAEIMVDPACGALTLFAESFDEDHTADWVVNKSTGTFTNDAGSVADFFFDYGALGIPPAPNSTGGTTRGLKLQANLTGNVFSGLSVSPLSRSFEGSYTLQFDMWLSFTGALNSTSFLPTFNTNYGILSDGVNPQWVGQAVNSVMFSNTNNGSSVADYRVFTPASSSAGGYQDPYPNASPVYASTLRTAGGVEIRNSAHPYYAFLGGATAPAAQLALFPTLTGSTNVGAAGFAWREVKIVKNGNQVVWSIDGRVMAALDLTVEGTTSGTNILFGQGDPDAASPTDPDAAALNFALFDNIRVARN